MIQSIKLKVGEVTIELSPEDARKLYNDLEQWFGQKTYITPYYPPLTSPSVTPWTPTWPYGDITCGGMGANQTVGLIQIT